MPRPLPVGLAGRISRPPFRSPDFWPRARVGVFHGSFPWNSANSDGAALFWRSYDLLRVGDGLAIYFRAHDRSESGLAAGEPSQDIHQLRDLRWRIKVHPAPR